MMACEPEAEVYDLGYCRRKCEDTETCDASPELDVFVAIFVFQNSTNRCSSNYWQKHIYGIIFREKH